ncbi:MAG: TlpA family protein disulfide reductase, partial [Gammaproteobacteria bacterium]|nr:TlpA family protein disulfide reductase [Gammaproteobacteria bacterium]
MPLFLLTIFRHIPLLSITGLLFIYSQSIIASPDVLLDGVDGNKHNLNEYIGKGKWTALNIWGTRCPPCLEEMPELVHFHDDHKDSKAIVVGVAIDFPSYGYANKNQVLEFIDDHLIEFPVLLSDANISEKIGAGRLEGLPTTYLYTPQGKLVGMQVGGITGNILENFIARYERRTSTGVDSSKKVNKFSPAPSETRQKK